MSLPHKNKLRSAIDSIFPRFLEPELRTLRTTFELRDECGALWGLLVCVVRPHGAACFDSLLGRSNVKVKYLELTSIQNLSTSILEATRRGASTSEEARGHHECS